MKPLFSYKKVIKLGGIHAWAMQFLIVCLADVGK